MSQPFQFVTLIMYLLHNNNWNMLNKNLTYSFQGQLTLSKMYLKFTKSVFASNFNETFAHTTKKNKCLMDNYFLIYEWMAGWLASLLITVICSCDHSSPLT